ncbi:MAG: YdcF family protein [Gallionella sp.]
MSWFITNIVATLLLPPLSLLLLLAVGITLSYRDNKLGKPVVITSFLLLWIAATPFFAEGSLHLLESSTDALPSAHPGADAIVILGGGTYSRSPEYGGVDTVSDASLPRLRYGARLHRLDGTPIMVTGGNPLGNPLPEAQQMRTALQQDFHVPVRWIEEESANTMENARLSFKILRPAGVTRIFLVTHAWHMPRAALAFRHAGFEVIEAPVAFSTRYRTTLLAFLPRAVALRDSEIFAHEVIGLAWYRLKLLFADD